MIVLQGRHPGPASPLPSRRHPAVRHHSLRLSPCPGLGVGVPRVLSFTFTCGMVVGRVCRVVVDEGSFIQRNGKTVVKSGWSYIRV